MWWVIVKKYIFVALFIVLGATLGFMIKNNKTENKTTLESIGSTSKSPEDNPSSQDAIMQTIETKGIKSKQAENLLVNFIYDESTLLDNKVQALWSMIKIYGLNSENGSLLMEYLAALGPLILTDELIDAYNNADQNNKNLILQALKNAFFNIEEDKFNISREEAYKFMDKIQQFSLSQIRLITEGNSTSNRNIIDLMMTTCPTDVVVNEIDNLKSMYGDSFFTTEDYARIQSSIATSDVSLQADRLTSLFSEAEKTTKPEDKQTINTEIQFGVARLLLSDTLNPYNATTPDSRYKIQEYLTSHKPSVDDLGNTGLTYNEWAKAMIITSSQSKKDEADVQYRMIMNTQDAKEMAAIISLNDFQIINELKNKGDINQIISHIEDCLADQKCNNSNPQLLQNALSQLKQFP